MIVALEPTAEFTMQTKMWVIMSPPGRTTEIRDAVDAGLLLESSSCSRSNGPR